MAEQQEELPLFRSDLPAMLPTALGGLFIGIAIVAAIGFLIGLAVVTTHLIEGALVIGFSSVVGVLAFLGWILDDIRRNLRLLTARRRHLLQRRLNAHRRKGL